MSDTPGLIVTGFASFLAALGFQRTMFKWQDNKINDMKKELGRKRDVDFCEQLSKDMKEDLQELKVVTKAMSESVHDTNLNLALLTKTLENWKAVNEK